MWLFFHLYGLLLTVKNPGHNVSISCRSDNVDCVAMKPAEPVSNVCIMSHEAHDDVGQASRINDFFCFQLLQSANMMVLHITKVKIQCKSMSLVRNPHFN